METSTSSIIDKNNNYIENYIQIADYSIIPDPKKINEICTYTILIEQINRKIIDAVRRGWNKISMGSYCQYNYSDLVKVFCAYINSGYSVNGYCKEIKNNKKYCHAVGEINIDEKGMLIGGVELFDKKFGEFRCGNLEIFW